MPVVEHSTVRMSEAVDYRRERTLVSTEQGATSLTVKEVELQPGWEGRMHTHPTDIAVMVTGGAIQMEIGDEIHTVRTGFTMVAPPGVPHRLINQLWMPATMLVIYPATELETNYL
ncbi:MAG: cupin domain-containing protein [Chloroflexi bacterium]|nr:cupin domain-containing protein [Chloroflexota bacterium]MCH8898582.1 cupin domain-containing protein [Chloroflexota bacterium]